MNGFFRFSLLCLISIYSYGSLFGQNQGSQDVIKDQPAAILRNAAKKNLTPERVIQLSNQALTLLSNTDRYELVAQAYQLLGRSYVAQNQLGSAIAYYSRSEKILVQLNDSASLAGVMNNIGDCYQMKSQFGLAIEYLQKALKISERLYNRNVSASVFNNLGIVYQQTGQYEQSLSCLNKALLLFEELGDKKGFSSTQNNMGITYSQLEKYEDALFWFNKAIEVKYEIKDTLSLANTYESLGQLYERTKNFNKAIDFYTESLRLHQLIKNNNGIAVDYINLAGVNIKLKNFQKAYECLMLSEKIAEQVKNYIAIKDYYKLLSDYYLAIGDPYQSREMMLKYALVFEKLFNKQVSDSLAEMNIQYETKQKESQNKLLQAKLELETFRHHHSSELQLFYIIFIVIVTSLLIYTLHFLRRLHSKNNQIENFNAKLQNLNLKLEGKVIDRTKELSDALEKAEESDKLKSAFLANMSHEIRTPMNGILGFTKILETDNIPLEERSRYAEVINRQGRCLLQIINDIVSLSKIETGQLEIKNSVCNLNKILDDIFLMSSEQSNLNRKNGVELKIVKSQSDNKCNIISDPIRIEQIFINLIDNAFKFTTEGEVEFGYTLEQNNTVRFFVKDTGSGIPEDQLERIFHRFYKHNQSSQQLYGGAGLGLSISKQLANLIGGDLWVESTVNKGSQFYFSIPHISADIHVYSTNSTFDMKNNTNYWPNKVVLIVEDDHISYQYIDALLKNTGFRIIQARSGEEAISICSADDCIDLVLMDIQLPFMSGYEATQQIRAIRKDLPIIAQTANVFNDEKILSLEAGCNYYIAKPIDADELYAAISKCMGECI